MKRTVAYDLDGTLFSIKQTIQMFNEKTNKNVRLQDIKKYNFAEYYEMTEEDYLHTWIEISERVVRESKINQKMLNNLKLEKSVGSEIIIVTARETFLHDLNKEILDELKIPYDRLYVGHLDKYDVLKENKTTRFFDDRGELVEHLMTTDLADTCELTIVDAPYNKNFSSHSRFIL